MGTDRAFHKDEPAIEKDLDPVFSYGEQKIYLNLWSVDILSTLTEQASQRNMHIGCRLGSKNAYFKMNVKIERKSQCNCFS